MRGHSSKGGAGFADAQDGAVLPVTPPHGVTALRADASPLAVSSGRHQTRLWDEGADPLCDWESFCQRCCLCQ